MGWASRARARCVGRAGGDVSWSPDRRCQAARRPPHSPPRSPSVLEGHQEGRRVGPLRARCSRVACGLDAGGRAQAGPRPRLIAPRSLAARPSFSPPALAHPSIASFPCSQLTLSFAVTVPLPAAMEDAHATILSLPPRDSVDEPTRESVEKPLPEQTSVDGEDGSIKPAFFAVYDGHGGASPSASCAPGSADQELPASPLSCARDNHQAPLSQSTPARRCTTGSRPSPSTHRATTRRP